MMIMAQYYHIVEWRGTSHAPHTHRPPAAPLPAQLSAWVRAGRVAPLSLVAHTGAPNSWVLVRDVLWFGEWREDARLRRLQVNMAGLEVLCGARPWL